MHEVRVPLPPLEMGQVAGTAIQADASAPFSVVGTLIVCWMLIADRYPKRSGAVKVLLTVLWALLMFLVFIVHEIGHLISARAAGAPMDVLLVNAVHWMTLYRDNTVSPEKHMSRAAGGPLANLLMFRVGRSLRWVAPPGPFGRDLVDAFAAFNAAICAVSLLPAPSFDGGALLKWSIFARTENLRHAASVVSRAGLASSGVLGMLASVGFVLGKRMWGIVLSAFSLVMALESLRRN